MKTTQGNIDRELLTELSKQMKSSPPADSRRVVSQTQDGVARLTSAEGSYV
jgi:hypothetical protein